MQPLRLLPSVFLVTALATAPACAATYKWVDEKGVVNYSNSLPPVSRSAAQNFAVVEERISVYSPDPALRRAAAARPARTSRDYAEAEWLQRQRIMYGQQVYAQQVSSADCPRGRVDCYRDTYRAGSYYYPYLPIAVFPGARARPAFFSPGPRMGRTPRSR